LAARSSRIESKSAAAAVTSDWPAGGGWEALPKAAGELEVRLFGRWTVAAGAQPAAGLAASLRPDTRLISFDARDLPAWDSVLIGFLCKLESLAEAKKIEVDRSGLPSGAVRLVALARAVPERSGARRDQARIGRLERLGTGALEFCRAAADLLAFFGEACIALGRLVTRRARLRRSDLAVAIEDCGPRALPVVALIAFLVGLILSFVGAIQLKQFGAAIYVANLVGIAMAREMGAMMTAILMSGRTGAAFAANIGTMQVNDEISALQTLGISPMEFLVLPRIVALALMMPLLAIFANVVGMAGGLLIAVATLDIAPIAYYHQLSGALGLTDWAIGLTKAAIFGVIVAIIGCWRGMRSARSAAAVGDAATSAVVLSIVLIIVVDAIATVICNTLGI
jgi:phospholipid/cholesterol/gamma-HCH transport system permease protein